MNIESAAANLSINNLTCEYLKNPLGIDVLEPRLSWMLYSEKRGEVQTAYQILVASSEENIAADKGDLWDSGNVESDQSVHVLYAGSKLASGLRCWWKVRVWDRDGKSTAWSEPAFWTMGLLSPSDWKGKWIASDVETLPIQERGAPVILRDQSMLFRKAFQASKPVKSAFTYTCGLGFFELYMNGKKVGNEVLQPGFIKYDKRALYITNDVTDLLKSGENAVGVMLGNGWYNSQPKDAWDFDKAPWRKTPRLLFQIVVEYTDGTSDTIVSDGTWKTSAGPIVFDSIRNGEIYDARMEKLGWDTAEYSDTDWKPVLMVDGPTNNLIAQKTAPVRVKKVLDPVSISEPKPGVFVFDFGQNLAGWGRLKVSGPAGTKVTIKYDERLSEDGLLNQSNAHLVRSGCFQTDTYIAKGEGVETWEPRFVYAGFQYAQVEGLPSMPTQESLRACVVHTDFENSGNFECSNSLLNRIQHCARWAYVGNFLGYPTDCPHREKNGWTGDAHLAAEMGFYNFNPAASYTKWMDDFADAHNAEGDLPGIVPTSGWGYGIGPAWDSAYILISWYTYLYCGDKRILSSHYSGFKRYVDFLTNRAEGHIVNYGLGDWCPPVGTAEAAKSPISLTSTGYYYIDTLIVSKVARLLGNDEDARKYSELAEAIRTAFNDKFYDKARGYYTGDCQTSQCTALYQGLAMQEEDSKIFEALLKEIDQSGGNLDCGILGTKYILHVLTNRGKADVAYNIATKRTFPSWGHWIDQGATTLWENWEGSASRNHIMFGDVSAWFYEAIAGISPDPDNTGFKHIIIKPNLVGDLKWAKADHISMYGRIGSSWTREGDGFTLEVDIPANTTATIYIPSVFLKEITEGGQPITKAVGVKLLESKDGCTVVAVGSGSYKFTVVR